MVPGPPKGLVATPSSATQIDLLWNPPLGIVTGYKITFAIDNGTFQDLVSNTGTNSTEFIDRNMMQNHTYSYQIYALNQYGQSNASNIAKITLLQSNKLPDAPTSLTLTPTFTGTMLSWIPPSQNSSSPIIGYKIEYSITPNHWIVLNSNTQSAQTFFQTTLNPVANYNYRVSAINAMGVGSPTQSVSNNDVTGTAPILTAKPMSQNQILLSWTPPSYTYNQQIIGYKIELKTGTTYATQIEDTGLLTSQTIDGLVTGKTYTYHVIALYAGGTQSPPSLDASVTPTETSIAPLQNDLPYGTFVFLGRPFPGSETSVALVNPGPQIQYFASPNFPVNGIWTNVSTNVKGTIIYFDYDGKTFFSNVNPDSNTWLSFPFPINISNVRMTINDRLHPNDLASVGYVSSIAQSVPSSPQNLTASLNNTIVKLSWSPPQNANPPVYGYNIQYKTSGDWFMLAQNIPTTIYTQSGLGLNKTYTFRVFALNSLGSSPPSNQTIITIPSYNIGGIISQVSNGIIPVGNTTTSLSYSISGGQVYSASLYNNTKSINFQLQGNTAGIFYLQLPRTLIDSKSKEGDDQALSITVNNKTAIFTETKTDTYRTLSISYPSGKVNVSITGTSVLGGTNVMAGTIPEFPLVIVGLVMGFFTSIMISKKFSERFNLVK